MKSFRTSALAIPLLLAPLASSRADYVTERSFSSPDGNLAFTLERNDADNRFYWSLNRAGTAIVTRGALGIDLSNVGTVADEGSISAVETRDIDTTWTPPFGERAVIPDHFHEETLTLASAGQGALTVKLQLRAYDEGLAFRYLVDGTGSLTMSGEKTSYPLPASAMAWVTSTSQGSISKVAITSMGNGMERPLTSELAPNLFIALGEAGSFDHARMKFSRSGASTLIPSLGGSSTFTDSLATPWRYVRAAASATGLLESNHLVLNLSEPTRIADTSWLRPGKMLREISLTTDGGIASVDWAAAHGIDFVHIDAGWYGPENSQSSDATTVTVDPARSPGPLDLQAVIQYATSKNIGVILYVNHIALERQLDEILPLYQQWGVAGIKFGFVNTGSQYWTKWLHDAIEKCAQHQLMVNVHDDYRMTGVERTLPNFMTAEGIRGDEESPPNEMVLRTLFTRCLTGAADQTNCYFAPRVSAMGSHASQLAKSVCIYSPWQYLYWYDSPANPPSVGGLLLEVPELGFFERLPTVWDETRWLQGHPETHAIVARRKGETWFLAALNGSSVRDFVVPQDFLPAGQNFRIELFSDDPAVATATDVQIETGVIDRDYVIARQVAVRNGFTAILTPTAAPLAPLLPTVAVDPPPPPPPPLPAGAHTFEANLGYPAATAQIAAVHGSINNSPFTGALSWALSTSNSVGRVVGTGNSGEYLGGQAFGTDGSGTYVGGLRGIIRPAQENTITFDAQYNSGITVGFMKDLDGDGRFDQGQTTPTAIPGDTGMGFGVGGSPVRFQCRNAFFGASTASPLAGTDGQWYRFFITIGPSEDGSRTIAMAVRNLSAVTDLDFDSATAGVQPWQVTVTDAAFGPVPEEADGVFVRMTGASRIDNLRVTAAAPPYQVWAADYPAMAGAAAASGADFDGDGIPNLIEFALDGDPAVANPAILPQASKVGGSIVLTFKRRDDSESSTALQLQVGGNLTDWPVTVTLGATDDSADGISWTVTENGTNPDLITVTIPEGTDPAKFVRLKVTGLP